MKRYLPQVFMSSILSYYSLAALAFHEEMMGI